MTPARHVCRPEQWRALFRNRGLAIVDERWPGSTWERLVHHPRLFVLDVPTWTRPAIAVEAPGGAALARA